MFDTIDTLGALFAGVLFFILVPLIGLGCLYDWLFKVRLRREIEDIPISNIHCAAQGFTAISGYTENLEEFMQVAPLSKRACLWYKCSVDILTSDGYESVFKEEGNNSFIPVHDETGICFIFHKDKDAIIYTEKMIWYGGFRHTLPEESTEPVQYYAADGKPMDEYLIYSDKEKNKYRFEEVRIEADEFLYTLGHFETLHTNKIPEIFTNHLIREEQSKIIKSWENKLDALITIYDKDKNGILSDDEWDDINQSALKIAEKEHARYKKVKYHIHLLKSYSSEANVRQPLIISQSSQDLLTCHVHSGSKYALIFGATLLIIWVVTFDTWASHIKNLFIKLWHV